MFTTIQKLRSSSAMQDRVTKVETFMKREYSNFTNETLIPVFMVGFSNSQADMDWVSGRTSTHVNVPVLSDLIAKYAHSPERIWKANRTKELARKALTDHYLEMYKQAGISDAKPNTPKFAWFAQEIIANASSLPKDVAAATEQATVSVQPSTETASAPTENSVTTTSDVPEDVQKLVAFGTSKEKRAKIIEGLGKGFQAVLLALHKDGVLQAGDAEKLIASIR